MFPQPPRGGENETAGSAGHRSRALNTETTAATTCRSRIRPELQWRPWPAGWAAIPNSSRTTGEPSSPTNRHARPPSGPTGQPRPCNLRGAQSRSPVRCLLVHHRLCESGTDIPHNFLTARVCALRWSKTILYPPLFSMAWCVRVGPGVGLPSRTSFPLLSLSLSPSCVHGAHRSPV